MSIFRRKTLQQYVAESKRTQLVRHLGWPSLILLGLGAIIGVGVFVLTGIASANYAGPAVPLAFVLGGTVCIFTALCYAELGTTVPVSGGSYAYLYVAAGEIWAWMAGWVGLAVYLFGIATVAAGWSGYVGGLLASAGVHLPHDLTAIPSQGGMINAPGVLMVAVMALLLMRGMKDAVLLNAILVAVKVGVMFVFIGSAVSHVNWDHWDPFMPFGFSGVVAAAGVIFTGFTGFDAIVNAAEESKNPQRDVPIGLIGSLVGSIVLYVLVSGLLTLIVPYHELATAEPIAYALRANGSTIGGGLVAMGAVAAMTSVLLVMVYAASRILMVLSRDGFLPPMFARVNKAGTPYLSLFGVAMLAMTMVGFVPLETVGKLCSLATLIIFTVVGVTAMLLRWREPDLHRPFRCPAIYWVGTIASVGCALIAFRMVMTDMSSLLVFGGVLLLGLVIYALYGYRHSLIVSRPESASRG